MSELTAKTIAELQSVGVPEASYERILTIASIVEGEAGVGYRMRSGFDLPPLMFTHEEAQALVASVRLAQPRLDPALAAQAEDPDFEMGIFWDADNDANIWAHAQCGVDAGLPLA